MKKKILSLLLILVITIIAVFSFTGSAHAMTNGWKSRPIPVYSDTKLSAMEVGQLKEAIASFNSTRFGTFFVYSGQKSTNQIVTSDNCICVTKAAFNSGSSANEDIARTMFSAGYTHSAVITFNTNKTYNNGSTSSGEYYLKSVLMHELFHALGFEDKDHFYFTNNVFNYTYTGNATLTEEDLALLDKIY